MRATERRPGLRKRVLERLPRPLVGRRRELVQPAIERQRLSVDGVSIYFQTAGAGQPLVLLHGLSGSGRWWARNVSALADRFRVHVLDLAGFGQSSRRQRFALKDAAALLVGWMDRLGIDRGSLVGHSMGGLIALEVAADYPDRLDKLVLVDAAVPPFRGGYLGQVFGLVGALKVLPPGFLPILFTDAWRAGPPTILNAARDLLRSESRTKLARVQAPTLIVWGERDTLVPLEIGEYLRACLPDAELVVIRGAGHNPMWDRADSFNRAILTFLQAGPSQERLGLTRR